MPLLDKNHCGSVSNDIKIIIENTREIVILEKKHVPY